MHGQPQYKASMCDPAELRAGNVFLEVFFFFFFFFFFFNLIFFYFNTTKTYLHTYIADDTYNTYILLEDFKQRLLYSCESYLQYWNSYLTLLTTLT